MKKNTFYLLVFLLFSINATSQTMWRFIDLAVKIESPEPYSIHPTPTVLDYTISILNQGPDTVFVDDTLEVTPSYARPATWKIEKRVFRVTEPILPGDSIFIHDTLSILYERNLPDFLLAVSAYVIKVRQYSERPIRFETDEIREDNTDFTRIILKHTVDVPVIKESSINIFPNPVIKENLNIVSLDNYMKNITVYDITGKVVYDENNLNSGKIEINVNDFKPGLYFVQVETNNEFITKKISVL
jgi:hypothetical protein